MRWLSSEADPPPGLVKQNHFCPSNQALDDGIIHLLFTWGHQVLLWAKSLQQICETMRRDLASGFSPVKSHTLAYLTMISPLEVKEVLFKRDPVWNPREEFCCFLCYFLSKLVSWHYQVGSLLQRAGPEEAATWQWGVPASFPCAAAAPWCVGEVMVQILNLLDPILLMFALGGLW